MKKSKRVTRSKQSHLITGNPVHRFIDAALGLHHSLFVSKVPRRMVFAIGKAGLLGMEGEEGEDEGSEGIVRRLTSENIKSVKCGMAHSFAWNDKGVLFSWGDGALGKLGHGADIKKRFAES